MSLFVSNLEKKGRGFEWHVGEPLPEIFGKVVNFQADGNELELLTYLLKNYRWTFEMKEKLKKFLEEDVEQ